MSDPGMYLFILCISTVIINAFKKLSVTVPYDAAVRKPGQFLSTQSPEFIQNSYQ